MLVLIGFLLTSSPLTDARSAIVENRAQDAIPLLEQSQGELDDYRVLLLGEAHAALGHVKEAQALLSSIPKAPREVVPCLPGCNHPLWVAAQESLAKTYEAHEPLKAADILMALPSSGPRLKRAIALYQVGRSEARLRTAEIRMLSEAPETNEGLELAKRIGPKGIDSRLDVPLFMKRLFRLLDAHRNQEARDEAKRSKRGPACDLAFVEGKAERKLRHYAAAITALERARARCDKTGDLWFRAALLDTEVRSISKDVPGARRVASLIAEQTPVHSYADDALLFLAEAYGQRDMQDLEDATYTKIVEQFPTGDKAPIAAWRLAFRHIKAGDLDTARLWLMKESANVDEPARAKYWIGRSYETFDRKKALETYEQAVTRPALTFYGWVALGRMQKLDPKRTKAFVAELLKKRDVADPPPAIPDVPAIRRARRLAEMELKDFARSEVALLEPRGGDVLPIAFAYDAVGAYADAQRLIRGSAKAALEEFPTGKNAPVWRAAYSEPFAEPLRKAAEAEKVDPYLLLALSREESTFDHAVVSWAGAVGLTQLMPPTAAGAYRDLFKKPMPAGVDLTDPQLNLRLGAHEFKQGLKRFGENPALALAAYNGGAGLTRRLLPTSTLPFDIWIESIYVRETRQYMKRVLQTWGIYRFLYAPDSPVITLPDEITPITAAFRGPPAPY